MLWNNDRKKETPKHWKTVQDFALYCTVARTLKQFRNFLTDDKRGFAILVMPEGYEADHYRRSAIDILHPNPTGYREDVDHFAIRAKTRETKIISEFVASYQEKKRLLAFAETRDSIPPVVALAADMILDLPPVSARDIQAACRFVAKMELSEGDAQKILEYPLAHVWPVLRPGRSAQEILKRLADADGHQEPPAPRSLDEVRPLSEMFGYGDAKVWGLEMAQDLKDWAGGKITWSDVDCGIVLSGPPGVGKTIFARSLAKQCGVSLVASSLGQWQSNGHLGDLLNAMRKDFEKAKDSAPVILFVDELDSFGDRNSFAHDNREYSVQVVNAFLECLDGLDGREGVVVIGATNNLNRIDPAILRSGRLDKHVAIPLPDGADRIRILHQQLDGSIPILELQKLAFRTQGLSGADLAKSVRDARRLARRDRRSVLLGDVEASLPRIYRIDDDHRRANAIHEAGHTVVGLSLGVGKFIGAELSDHVFADRAVSAGGQASFAPSSSERRDKQVYLNRIAHALAGTAAEELVLGTRSDGAGLVEGSDVEIATKLATIMETQSGLGISLRYSRGKNVEDLDRIMQSDKQLRDRIDLVLDEQFGRAFSILQSERELLERIAGELFAVGKVTPESLARLLPSAEVEDRPALLQAS